MRLRTLTTIAIACVILTAAGLAGAAGGPPWNGTFYAHMDNYDASRTYTGFLADGTTPVTPGVEYTPAQLQYFQPTSADSADETSWGVFRFQQVLRGEVTGPNTITKVPAPGNVLWTEGDGNRELVGIFYDRRDISVTFTDVGHKDGDGVVPDESLYYQIIKADNTKYKMWYQTWGHYDNGDGGPDTRVAIDNYPTVGDEPGNTDFVLLGEDTTEIFTVFDPAMYIVNLTGNSIVLPSTTSTYVMLTDGPWLTDGYFVQAFPLGGATAPDAHLSLNSTLKPTDKPNDVDPTKTAWDIASSDPITGHVIVPEPVTMLGVLAGVSGLFGYIRKRRK